LHPILFDIFGYQMHTYSVAMAMGFVVAIILLRRRAPLEQIDPDFALNLAILCIVGTLVGGRLMFVINTWRENFATADRTSWQVFVETMKIWKGGLVFYGGFFASALFVWAYCRLHKQPFLPLGDLLAPYTAIGLSIHRTFGCYMNGCCFGAPSTLPWAVHFPLESQATRVWGVETAVHPTELYMGANALFLFFVLRWYRQYKQGHGEVFGLLFMLYSINRGLIEIVRGDPIRGHVPALNLLYFVIFAVGVVFWLYARGLDERHKWAEWAGLAIVVGAAVAGVIATASGSENSTNAATPFSTSQFLGFFTFVLGAACYYYARNFGARVQPDYGTLTAAAAE
jgi:phosphatidylglycerol:prolipoprotein diacylglycerol transferase